MKSNVNIQCILNNSLECSTYYIFVCYKEKIIYQDYQNFNEMLNLRLKPCRDYKIIILTTSNILPTKYITDIFVERNICKNLLFNFSAKNNDKPKTINFLVTDKFYQGLLIEKGELKICQ